MNITTSYRLSFIQRELACEKNLALIETQDESEALLEATETMRNKLEDDFLLWNSDFPRENARRLAEIILFGVAGLNGNAANLNRVTAVQNHLADFRTWLNQQLSWKAKISRVDVGKEVAANVRIVEGILYKIFADQAEAPVMTRLTEIEIPAHFTEAKPPDKEAFKRLLAWRESLPAVIAELRR